MAEASFMDRACGLSPALLSVLPEEEHEQLEVAHRITCHAYAHKVSKLETESEQLQSELVHSQQTVKALERRMAGMESELVEQQQRARHAMSEQHKLVAEKNALIETVKRLNREVAKLEHFKRNLLQQLQDDCDGGEAAGSTYAAVDITTERLVSEVLHSADGIAAAAAAAAAGGAAAPGTSASTYNHHQQQQQWHGSQQQQLGGSGGGQDSWSPQQGQQHGAGRLHGPGSPGTKLYASGGYHHSTHTAAADSSSAAGGGGGGSSPYRSAARPASAAAKEGTAALQQGSRAGSGGGHGGGARGLAAAANMVGPRFSSPPQQGGGGVGRAGAAGGGAGGRVGAATSPRIDGKEFFRQARARLSYEQFSQFLVAIKDLNAGRASREDTLGAAKALFGPGNGDLYGLFEGLLMRHLTSF